MSNRCLMSEQYKKYQDQLTEHEKEFLPAVLEVTEMPPSHAARVLTYVMPHSFRFFLFLQKTIVNKFQIKNRKNVLKFFILPVSIVKKDFISFGKMDVLFSGGL